MIDVSMVICSWLGARRWRAATGRDAADRRPGPSARFSCCLFVRGLLRVYPAADPRCLDGCQKTEKYAGRCIEVCPQNGLPCVA